MVGEHLAWVVVSTNSLSDSDTLVGAVGDKGNNVVELVGDASGLGDVANATRAAELGRDDVVHMSSNRQSRHSRAWQWL